MRAIIHAESAFNPNALSRVGAQGLMQLMPATARRFGVSQCLRRQRRTSAAACKYLAWLLKRFNGNLTLAAAGYNAGEGAVDKYKGVPPYSETQRYVRARGDAGRPLPRQSRRAAESASGPAPRPRHRPDCRLFSLPLHFPVFCGEPSPVAGARTLAASRNRI